MRYSEKPKLQLPEPRFQGLYLEDAIRRRRSIRDYSGETMSIMQISVILFAAQGISGEVHGQKVRTAPSAGALYPIDLYAFVNNVEDIQLGLYYYSPTDHSLFQLKKGDFRKSLFEATLEQDMVKDANVVIVLTSIPKRIVWKYRDRAQRYIFMEAGHISQNIYLQATSLGLGSVAIGAFYDEKIGNLMDLDLKQETPIYIHTVGKI